MSDPRLDPNEEPDTVATPEGDNEYPGDVPLTPAIVEDSLEGLQVPPGSKPRP